VPDGGCAPQLTLWHTRPCPSSPPVTDPSPCLDPGLLGQDPLPQVDRRVLYYCISIHYLLWLAVEALDTRLAFDVTAPGLLKLVIHGLAWWITKPSSTAERNFVGRLVTLIVRWSHFGDLCTGNGKSVPRLFPDILS
jgi:hypothetical protein